MFHQLVHAPNACSCQSCACLKPGVSVTLGPLVNFYLPRNGNGQCSRPKLVVQVAYSLTICLRTGQWGIPPSFRISPVSTCFKWRLCSLSIYSLLWFSLWSQVLVSTFHKLLISLRSESRIRPATPKLISLLVQVSVSQAGGHG